jgi:hypothetical protein
MKETIIFNTRIKLIKYRFKLLLKLFINSYKRGFRSVYSKNLNIKISNKEEKIYKFKVKNISNFEVIDIPSFFSYWFEENLDMSSFIKENDRKFNSLDIN